MIKNVFIDGNTDEIKQKVCIGRIDVKVCPMPTSTSIAYIDNVVTGNNWTTIPIIFDLSDVNTSPNYAGSTTLGSSEAWVGLKNVVGPLGFIRIKNYTSTNNIATQSIVEYQPDNDPNGTWLPIKENIYIHTASAVNGVSFLDFGSLPKYIDDDKLHCIRIRALNQNTSNRWVISEFSVWNKEYILSSTSFSSLGKYDTGWFKVDSAKTYDFNNNLGVKDIETEIFFKPMISSNSVRKVGLNGTTTLSPAITINEKIIHVSTGTSYVYQMATCSFNEAYNTGYYRCIFTRKIK